MTDLKKIKNFKEFRKILQTNNNNATATTTDDAPVEFMFVGHAPTVVRSSHKKDEEYPF